ncbi:NahK/ErcS family hybrid sensor histidine kinase/response regulator [Telmatospirillum siberiense]|nr:NahK/ErcS family hybrid sensor histidine kinase/response regulator [Telmatospirillum siberiense]
MAQRPPSDEAWSRLAELERENAKLRKINQVLIDRVERSMDFQGNAYSLFQTAIVLENQVRDRTEELGSALRELGKINRDLHFTKEEAETARVRLTVAIESISEGFVLCDANDRLVMCNGKYREFWPGLTDMIKPGVPFTALLRRAQSLGLFDTVEGSGEEALQQRLQYHERPEGLLVVKLTDGRWLQINEQRTEDGGSVAIYTDITALKLSEQRQRERELAVKNTLLQAIFHNISQGILVVDEERRIVAWNDRFLEILKLPSSELAAGKSIRDFIHVKAVRCLFIYFGFGSDPNHFDSFCMEETGDDGRVVEIRLSPMPGGGIVSTYTDITERKRSEWALRDSEHRIRVITDALPALIAYVDAEQCFRFTNKPYEDWFGRPRSEINGQPMSKVLGRKLYEARQSHVELALSGRNTTFEIDLSTTDQKFRYALATYVPHFGPDGTVLGFFALIQDITERKEAARQLQEAKEGLELRVAERTRELTTLNLQLKQEVEERRQAEEALHAAKAEAEQANMSKTKFLAAASHDLLQPLNAARVFAAALGESRMAERNRDLVANVTLALNSVDELLSALLDISKFDAGAHTPDIVDFRLDGILKSLVDEHVPQAKVRQLGLHWVSSSAVVRTDPVLITRILRNFLSNAMRYTHSGRILLGCRRRPDGVEVQVWDTGIGIPPDKLTAVFEEFHRLDAGSRENDRGMGLGLAIVERISRRLGHQVVVRSQLGKGSLFGIVLPYGNPQRVSLQAAGFELPPTVDRVADTSVIVIENDPGELAGMKALLQSWRCEVQIAKHKEGALQQLRAAGKPPQVVVADYQLDDGATGLEAFHSIQALFALPIPGIIITADRTDEVHAAIRRAGCHLLNKPLKPARLRSLLAHLTAHD